MKNFVISLTSATDRRQHIINEFGKQNIPFEFFDAITPPLSRLKDLAQEFNVDINNCTLTEPELACFFSHVCLWQKALDEKLDYIAIFEDDIYLSHDAHLFLISADWIPTDSNFIKIEKVSNKIVATSPKIKTINQHYLFRLQSFHVGTGGYILSSKIIKNILKYIQNTKVDHIDQILFKHLIGEKIIPIYQLNPVVCIQDCILYPDNQKFKTHLDWRNNQEKTRLSTLQKLIREIKRPYQQLKDKLQQVELEFHK